MSLRYWHRHPADDTFIEITDRCGWWPLSFTENAEEGSTATNTVMIDDPDGDFIPQLNASIGVEETEAEDPEDTFIAVGFISRAKIARGDHHRTGVGRVWECELQDANAILARRVMVGGDNDRPAETDVARMQWLMSTTEGSSLIGDTRYLSTDDPENMDAADYLLQDMPSIPNDCAQQTGKNYYVTYFGDNGVDDPNPWGYWSFWYGDPASSDYLSTARLSNELDEIDNVTTFPLFIEDELDVDGSRIYSKVVVPYKGSYVVAERPQTITDYARREVVMSAPNVSTKATADARAYRYVNDLKTPDYTATVSTIVPRTKVNAIRPGMAVQVHATHWESPMPAGFTYMRVLNRRVEEISDDDTATYKLTMDLSWAEPTVSQPVEGTLYKAHGPYLVDGYKVVYWESPGDSPPTGRPLYPTVGPITPLQDATPPNARDDYYGWQMDGTGTVDYRVAVSLTGVRDKAKTYTVTLEVFRVTAGVYTLIQSQAVVVPSDGNGWSSFSSSGAANFIDMTNTDVAVTSGDLLIAHLTCTPAMAFFRTPSGVGGGYNNFEITGGSLA